MKLTPRDAAAWFRKPDPKGAGALISGEDVMRLLLDLVRQEGLTLVVISHRLEHTLGYSDRILGLSQGRISLDTATRQADAASLRHFFDHEGSTP